MDIKKVAIIICAVIAFVAGQFLLKEAFSTTDTFAKTFLEFLIPIFELIAGGFLGFFYKKFEDSDVINNYESKYANKKEELTNIINELTKLKESKAKNKTKTKVS